MKEKIELELLLKMSWEVLNSIDYGNKMTPENLDRYKEISKMTEDIRESLSNITAHLKVL